MMAVTGYLNEIRTLAASGQDTEHSYRSTLELLFKSFDDNLMVINEPKRLTDFGARDFDVSVTEQSNISDMDIFRQATNENISETRVKDQPK